MVSRSASGRDELMDSLQRVVAEVLGPSQDRPPRPDLTFAEVGLDSMSQLEVLNRLESQLGVTVPYEIADQVRTVGDLLDALLDLVQADGSALDTPAAPAW